MYAKNFEKAKAIYAGTTKANKIYIGNDLIWQLVQEELLEGMIFEPSSSSDRMSTSEIQLFKNNTNVFLREPYKYNIRQGSSFIESSLIPNLNDDALLSTRVPIYEVKFNNPYKDVERIIIWNSMSFKGTITLNFTNGKTKIFNIDYYKKSTSINDQLILDLKSSGNSSGNTPTPPTSERTSTTFTQFEETSYSRYLLIGDLTNKVSTSQITRVKIGNLGEIKGTDIDSLDAGIINFKNTLGTYTGGRSVPSNTQLTIYYQ